MGMGKIRQGEETSTTQTELLPLGGSWILISRVISPSYGSYSLATLLINPP